MRQIQAVAEQLTVVDNQVHALQKGMFRDKPVEKMHRQHIRLLQQNKQALQLRVAQTIEQEEQLKGKVDNRCVIKGLGVQTLAGIIAETNGFAAFENINHLVSYSGYDVVENTSATTVGTTRISRKGNGHIRRSLYFPALNVVKYEVAPFKQLFDSVYEKTRIKIKAYMAVQRKLLTIIYVLWKKEETFDPSHGNQPSGEAEGASAFASPPQGSRRT